MEAQTLIPNLFRTEYRKIVAVLCKHFGIRHLQVAEDIASETFLLATETWGQKGIPQNPVAWLYAVAKNKAIDFLRHEQVFQTKVSHHIRQNTPDTDLPQIDLSLENIRDSQLQMMFAICHPAISPEAQIGLSLSILCGFGTEEIAEAFLTTRDAIYKRLARAKEILKRKNISIALPGKKAIDNRLETVLKTLYLLFNEGYYSSTFNTPLRKEFCREAMRLNLLLTDNELTSTPAANALLSLMCFHASRFEARTGPAGDQILYDQQDEASWDQQLIAKGNFYLQRSSYGNDLSKYHLEAAIGYWHTRTRDSREKWENILGLYEQLLGLEYSPVVAMNKAYALSKARGKAEGIAEAEKLQLTGNHLYYSLLAYLYTGIDSSRAILNLRLALDHAKSGTDKNLITSLLERLMSEKV